MARRAPQRAEPGRPATKEPRVARVDRSLDPVRGSLHPTQRLARELDDLRHEPGTILSQEPAPPERKDGGEERDRKSTRLNSSHLVISYAVFCLKKKKTKRKKGRCQRFCRY